MDEEKCKKCRKGYLKKTEDPRESKCEICGWSVIELTLYDLVESRERPYHWSKRYPEFYDLILQTSYPSFIRKEIIV